MMLGGLVPILFGLMSWYVFRRAFQSIRFGHPDLILESSPVPLGQLVRARVNIALNGFQEVAYEAVLRCVERRVRANDQRASEVETWSDQCVVETKLVDDDPTLTQVMVVVAAPQGGPPTDFTKATRWELVISGRRAGVDFREGYDVPVFEAAPRIDNP